MINEFDYSLPAYQTMFGNYGLTALAATSFEKTVMLLLIAVSRISELNVPPSELYKAMDEVNHLTLGRLITELKKRLNVTDSTASELESALKRRNYLIHHFFFAHREMLRTPEGAHEMSNELRPMRDLFVEVQKKIDLILGAVLQKHSLDLEIIDKEVRPILEGG